MQSYGDICFRNRFFWITSFFDEPLFLQSVNFKAGNRLLFNFHSDGSNNEWGYKFTVSVCHASPVLTFYLLLFLFKHIFHCTPQKHLGLSRGLTVLIVLFWSRDKSTLQDARTFIHHLLNSGTMEFCAQKSLH